MVDPGTASIALAELHSLVNSAKNQPARVVDVAGIRLQIRPGQDAAYPSTSSNRAIVYNSTGLDIAASLSKAREEFSREGISHWFAMIGPGASGEAVHRAVHVLGARVWPYVTYPALARTAEKIAMPATSLKVRRVERPEIIAHAEDLAQFCDQSGVSTFSAAAALPGFVHVMAFEGQRAVGAGLLALTRGAAYLCFGGTLDGFRRRGAQSAMIALRVNIAAENGCKLCLCETVSMLETSLNNLVRAGFERVFDWVMIEVGTPVAAPPA